MMPLGITHAQIDSTYVPYLFKTHDFAVTIDVIQLDHTPIRSLTVHTLDGQINLQRDAAVCRTATFTFADPNHSLHFDADSPWQGAEFAEPDDPGQHHVTVPGGLGRVTTSPFVGPITKVARDGDEIAVECQDKACLALTGTTPMTAKKGTNAVDAIRRIMTRAAGGAPVPAAVGQQAEPAEVLLGRLARRGLPVGGVPADRRPAQHAAAVLLRRVPDAAAWPPGPAINVGGAAITDNGLGRLRLLCGLQHGPGDRDPGAAEEKDDQEGRRQAVDRAAGRKLSAVAVTAHSHPLSPSRLGRNGVSRYLPTIIEGAVYKSLAQAPDRWPTTTLSRDLLLTTGGLLRRQSPVFHLVTSRT